MDLSSSLLIFYYAYLDLILKPPSDIGSALGHSMLSHAIENSALLSLPACTDPTDQPKVKV